MVSSHAYDLPAFFRGAGGEVRRACAKEKAQICRARPFGGKAHEREDGRKQQRTAEKGTKNVHNSTKLVVLAVAHHHPIQGDEILPISTES